MKLRNKKTDEIIDSACIGVFKHQSSGDCERLDTEASSLSKFLEQWEDYGPKEPLIRDPKIRKAVRAWAEANNSTKMVFDGYHLASDEHGNDIEFSNSWAENVKHGEWYTITELCGGEQE